ncbi:MAG: maltose ABC transporter permease MalF [Chloroflexota bacterium]
MIRFGQSSLRALFFKLAILAVVDAFAIQLSITLGTRIGAALGIAIAVFTIIVNIVFLDERLYPWRWISPALAGMFLLVVYPMAYSVTVAFTNRGDGHTLTKQQVLGQWEATYFTPDNAEIYKAYIFARPVADPQQSDFRFWLVDPDGKTFIASSDVTGLQAVPANDTTYGARDSKDVPNALGEFVRITPQRYSTRLAGLTIQNPPHLIKLTKLLLLDQAFQAQTQEHVYVYDSAKNEVTDQQTNKVYREERGNFVTGTGADREILVPGFEAYIGFDNLLRVVLDANVRDPFWRIFAWTVVFAVSTVVTQFALGLLFALVLNSPDLPLRPLWRSLLIIPYAVPFWLGAEVWRGLLNPSYGPINLMLKNLIGISPQWFSDPGLAKLMILFVNMYLGFSYMMLISLGALQSIPHDIYEAAVIDGANDIQRFRFMTLPLILVAVGPLLIASFAFNFNNFTIIELLNNGGPPMSAASVAGHTDILLSYTYRLAFSGAQGADYGFAAAVGMFIFVIVATLTFLNFRFTGALEKVAENG